LPKLYQLAFAGAPLTGTKLTWFAPAPGTGVEPEVCDGREIGSPDEDSGLAKNLDQAHEQLHVQRSQNGVLLTMNSDSKLEPPRWRPGPAEEALTRRER